MKIQSLVTATIGATALVASVYFAFPSNAASCVTSATDGLCGPYDISLVWGNNGGPEVVQDWQQKSVGSQILTAGNPGSWNVTANMPAGNTSVISYPDVRNDYTPGSHPTALSAFPTLSSTFAQSDPAGTGQDYEWAYDLWLGDTTQASWLSDQEIMIWTDNHGQRPAGSDTGQVFTDSRGVGWEVWAWAGSNTVSSKYQTVSLVRQQNTTSDSLNLGEFITWLQNNGYTSSSAGIDQVDYGAEICSTGGASLTYAITQYTFGVTAGPTPTPTPTVTPSPVPSPAGLSQTAHVIVNFGWHAVPGWTGSYEFQLADSAGVIAIDRTVSTTHVSSVPVAGDTTYQWRARATGGAWSGWRVFTTP